MDGTNRVVHLAGNSVVLGDRCIQRCLICGEKLCDNLSAMVAQDAHGTAPPFATWGLGAWIEHEGNRWGVIGETDSPTFKWDQIPEDCCLELVE